MKKNFVGLFLLAFIFLLFTFQAYSREDPYSALSTTEAFMPDQPLSINVRNVRDTAPVPNKYTGWLPVIKGRLYGPVKDGDAVKIELLKDGKPVRSYRVPLQPLTITEYEYFQDWELTNYEDKDPLSSEGEFGLVFKYVDFASEKERILAEKKITIVRAGSVDGFAGVHIWKYGIMCGELPAISYMFLKGQPSDSSRPVFFFTWINRESDFIDDIKYKISVNGTPLEIPSDFSLSCNRKLAIEQEEDMYDYQKMAVINNRYRLYLMEFGPKLYWGQKDELQSMGGWICMGEHPGDWSVKVYSQGKMIREFRFNVTSEGTVSLHPEQDPAKKGSLVLGPMRFFIETYFPNPNDFDDRFSPAEMKKDSFFGRPWISSEIQGMLNALPPEKPGAMPFPSTKLLPDKH